MQKFREFLQIKYERNTSWDMYDSDDNYSVSWLYKIITKFTSVSKDINKIVMFHWLINSEKKSREKKQLLKKILTSRWFH